MDILKRITQEFNLREDNVKNIVELLDEGNTIPFIARYRKERTGHIDDQVLRDLADRLTYLRNLEKRKEEVFANISEQQKMTDEIADSLSKAETLTEVEDIYRPFKQKKKTRATVAISKGLEPLADLIVAQSLLEGDVNDLAKPFIDAEKGVNNEKEAIDGAKDIIAERVSDNAELRKKLRNIFLKNGEIITKIAKITDEAKLEEAKTYEMYSDYSEPIAEIKNHRILAINRGEKENFLKVKLSIDKDFAVRVCSVPFVREGSITTYLVKEAVADAYDRLIFPAVEREVRSVLTEGASEQAIKMFEVNLEPLLMQPPIRGKITMGFDPGFRTGCKIAVVDETGKFLAKAVVYPTLGSDEKNKQASDVLTKLINEFSVDVISIGNGTASKESEIFVAELLKSKNITHKCCYTIVSEAGASVYSASKLGAQEFPDFDVSERSAVSIARRLQDPLAELIKIDPKSIGVGQYQHDMPQARLDSVLTGVLEDCVNKVGVNVNTASPSLLSYVAGLNSAIAKNIVTFREEKGKFTSRTQLLKVPKLGEKAFLQCAGFLRIDGGKNIFDNTGVHPESYDGAKKLIELFGYTEKDVECGNIQDLPEKIKTKKAEVVAKECGLGVPTLNDIVAELLKPGRDVRDSLPQPELRSDIMSISDLTVGMQLKGIVRNVIDFGAFIDLGVHQDGLVHISQISDGYIKHPSDVLKVGQQVMVTVIGVDLKKNRISLSMRKNPQLQTKEA